jgi:putative ABC transport system substrate-binding protein
MSRGRNQAGALIVMDDAFFNEITVHLVVSAVRSSIPVIFPRREFTVAGGLLSYGTSLSEACRQVGIYTGRILNGATPVELPILLPSRYELVLNLKTANLCRRADEARTRGPADASEGREGLRQA